MRTDDIATCVAWHRNELALWAMGKKSLPLVAVSGLLLELDRLLQQCEL